MSVCVYVCLYVSVCVCVSLGVGSGGGKCKGTHNKHTSRQANAAKTKHKSPIQVRPIQSLIEARAVGVAWACSVTPSRSSQEDRR